MFLILCQPLKVDEVEEEEKNPFFAQLMAQKAERETKHPLLEHLC